MRDSLHDAIDALEAGQWPSEPTMDRLRKEHRWIWHGIQFAYEYQRTMTPDDLKHFGTKLRIHL